MATMKANITNYTQAMAFLRNSLSKIIGNNTYVRLNHKCAELILHGSVLVRWHSDNVTVEVFNGGYASVTTKSRLNDFSPVSVYQKRGNWYFSNGKPFVSGSKFVNGILV